MPEGPLGGLCSRYVPRLMVARGGLATGSCGGATIVFRGPLLELSDVALGSDPVHPDPEQDAAVLTLAECERRHILQVLERASWRISGVQGAAHLLGLPVSTLRSRMKKLGIERPRG